MANAEPGDARLAVPNSPGFFIGVLSVEGIGNQTPTASTTAASTGPRARGQRTFERLWAELDCNEDILNERLVRVATHIQNARLGK